MEGDTMSSPLSSWVLNLKVMQMTFFIIIFGFVIVWNYTMGKRKPTLRGIAALESIDEIAGRAAEMNRPVHFCVGSSWGSMSNTTSFQTLSGLSLLTKVAHATARVKAKIIFTSPQIETAGLVTETIANAYRAEGAIDIFDPIESVVMKSPYIYAWLAMVMQILHSRQCAGSIVMASGSSSQFAMLEAGVRIGAIQMIGNPGMGEAQAFGVVLADHALMGPEVYGVGAVVSEEIDQWQTLIACDLLNIVFILTFLVGVVFASIGNTYWSGLFKY